MSDQVPSSVSARRYTRAACSAAIANPLHFVRIEGCAKPDAVAQRIKKQVGPKMLHDRSIDGHFDVFESHGVVWLRFIYPWQDTEVGRVPPAFRKRRPREAPAGNHDEPSGASTAAVTADDTAGVK